MVDGCLQGGLATLISKQLPSAISNVKRTFDIADGPGKLCGNPHFPIRKSRHARMLCAVGGTSSRLANDVPHTWWCVTQTQGGSNNLNLKIGVTCKAVHRVFCSPSLLRKITTLFSDEHLQVRSKYNTTMSPDGRLSKMPGSASMREADLEHHPGQGIGAWNPKTPRDESEMYKNRFEDPKFSVGT